MLLTGVPAICQSNSGKNGTLQGLFIFVLPPYYSEMNPIEEDEDQLKTHKIAGQMFDNSYDLAMTIIDGMKNRSIKGGYTLERFIFN